MFFLFSDLEKERDKLNIDEKGSSGRQCTHGERIVGDWDVC